MKEGCQIAKLEFSFFFTLGAINLIGMDGSF